MSEPDVLPESFAPGPYKDVDRSRPWFGADGVFGKLSVVKLLCILVTVGAPFWYYKTFFHFHPHDRPLEGLTWIKGASEPQLNSFRKSMIAKIIDPTIQQNARLKEIRKSFLSKKTGWYETFAELQEDSDKIAERLKEILAEAKLRRIPSKYKKRYVQTILAIGESYRAARQLSSALDAEDAADQESRLKESGRYIWSSNRKLRKARDYFEIPERSSPSSPTFTKLK